MWGGGVKIKRDEDAIKMHLALQRSAPLREEGERREIRSQKANAELMTAGKPLDEASTES